MYGLARKTTPRLVYRPFCLAIGCLFASASLLVDSIVNHAVWQDDGSFCSLAKMASPSGVKAAFWETCTPTVKPEEVLALVVSGETVIVGGNWSFEHPVSETGVPAALCVSVLLFAHRPGLSHESAAIVERRGP